MREATATLKRLALIFFTVSLLVCCAAGKAAATSPAGDKPKHNSEKTLRVLYWNIQNGMWAGQQENYKQFVEWIKSYDPDICIFCEGAQIYYDGTHEHMPNEDRYLPEHWDELCARWGHEYVRVNPRRPSTSTPYGLTNYPCLVTSRYPIDSIAIVKGSQPDSVVVNYSGWYQINVPGPQKPLNIVTVHLKHGKYGRGVPPEQRQASADRYEGDLYRARELTCILNGTVRKTTNPDKELWIMAGDYNSYSRKDNGHYKWNNASPGFTAQDYMIFQSPFYDLVKECYPDDFFPSCGNLRIDYMYVSKPMLKACEDVYAEPDNYTRRVKDPTGATSFFIPSDHYPIIADFKLSKMK